jgi:hypothetical protein
MNRNDWIRGLWANGGIPVGPIDADSGVAMNVLVGVTWIESEGSTAANNPLDTTQPWPGSTYYNSVGVRNYPSVSAGWAATLSTLKNGDYNSLLYELMHPINAEMTIAAIHASPWGSKPTETMLDNVRNNWVRYADAYVSGTGQSPSPPLWPIVPMPQEDNMLIAGTPNDDGYWECEPSTGAIYAYGSAVYFGGLNNYQGKNVMVAGDVVTGLASCRTKFGYWITTAKGFTYNFGGAPYLGSPV